MTPPGLAAFEARDARRTGIYSFEHRPASLAPGYLKAFRANRRSWAYFEARPPWYRRTSIFWVMSARREEMRRKRLVIRIGCSARRDDSAADADFAEVGRPAVGIIDARPGRGTCGKLD